MTGSSGATEERRPTTALTGHPQERRCVAGVMGTSRRDLSSRTGGKCEPPWFAKTAVLPKGPGWPVCHTSRSRRGPVSTSVCSPACSRLTNQPGHQPLSSSQFFGTYLPLLTSTHLSHNNPYTSHLTTGIKPNQNNTVATRGVADNVGGVRAGGVDADAGQGVSGVSPGHGS
jgi:hypothetical protein